MKRFPQTSAHARRLCSVLGALAFALPFQTTWANESFPEDEATNAAKNLARMNCGAKIQCILPEDTPRPSRPKADGQGAAALIMDDDTLSVPLEEGETTFIITLPTTSLVDRFSFVNENAAARGESQDRNLKPPIAAASKKWVEVDGQISFTDKRLFNISLMGVEARYVKLSFNVEKGGRIASLGLYGDKTLQGFAQRQHQLTWIANTSNVSVRKRGSSSISISRISTPRRASFT